MKKLTLSQHEEFTQYAYLNSVGIFPDSKISISAEVSYAKCNSVPDRWANCIAKCRFPESNFNQVDDLIFYFESDNINVNWHLWPSSDKNLLPYLEKKNFVNIGTGCALAKVPSQFNSNHLTNKNYNFHPIFLNDVERYVEAKITSWQNCTSQKSLILAATKTILNDKRNYIFILRNNEKIIAGTSAFIENNCVYLKGSFVLPDYRKKGIYNQLISLKEHFFKDYDIKYFVTIADLKASAPILIKNGYQEISKLSILAKYKTPWVSL